MADGIFFAMTFAEQLMQLIYLNEDISWQPEESMHRIFPEYINRDKTLDILKVVTAIEVILERNSEDIAGCHADLVENEAVTRSGFGYYAIKAIPAYFPYGYCPERMLAFLAMVSGVCRMCFQKDSDNEVLDSAAQVIGMVVTAYTLTGEFDLNAFDEFVKVAEKVVGVLVGKKDKK